MLESQTTIESGNYGVERWELGLLFVEVVLLAGVALGFFWTLGSGAVWQGAGFFLLGLALYPVLRIQSRNARGRALRFSRWVVAALIGSLVGSLLTLLLS